MRHLFVLALLLTSASVAAQDGALRERVLREAGVDPNMRAVTVRAAAPGPVPFLKGDYVDVIATGLAAARAVVENVWLLHPGIATADEPRNVVLVTTTDQAEILVRVQQSATANLGADLVPVQLTLVRRGRGLARPAASKLPSSHK